jgi:hypothetical protein
MDTHTAQYAVKYTVSECCTLKKTRIELEIKISIMDTRCEWSSQEELKINFVCIAWKKKKKSKEN